MPMLSRTLKALSLSLLILFGLTACNSMSTKPLPEETPAFVSSEDANLSTELQIRYADQAKNIMTQASDTPSPLKEQLYMKAAEYLLLANRIPAAYQANQKVNTSTLSPADAFRHRLINAEIDIKRNRVRRATTLLEEPPPAGLPKEQLLRLQTDRAVAYFRSGKMLESAKARTELDKLIDDPELKTANQKKIITSLATLSDTALELLQPNPPTEMNGWMELARVFKRHGKDFIAARPQFENWKARFPSHPAANHLYASHHGNVQAQYKKLGLIAVLLPESGPMQKFADTIRQGIKLAYEAQPASTNKPQLRFYDSSNPQEIPTLYQRAVSDGANAIIGPLNKAAVNVLASGGNLPVPTLALNQVQMTVTPPSNLYQFSLSPEDEARQVAERAWNDGHTQAIALVPEGAWGARVLEAFRQQFIALGGRLSEHQSYDPKKNDFSAQIKPLLNLDDSIARKNRLQRIISRELEFVPSRRRDAEFIFLGANSVLARQIRPQLQFHHAGDLKIYATARVFSGSVNPRADQDINGIRFLDAPWLLNRDSGPLSRRSMAQQNPATQKLHPRLLAMGIDSYNLLPNLERLNNGKFNETTEGKTGRLYMDQYGLIHRHMIWADIVEGQPKVIGYAPRSKIKPKPLPSRFSSPSFTGDTDSFLDL